MKTLYFDCFSGVSGDMTIGALIDLGLDFDYLRTELGKLELDDFDPATGLAVSRVDRSGISASKFDVRLDADTHSGSGHSHAPHAHGSGGESDTDTHTHTAALPHFHRRASDIVAMIASSRLDSGVRELAVAIFEKLAIAEGKVHHLPPGEVEFHEVGAIDSIVDVVGAAIGIQSLAVESVGCSPINVGGGFIHCQHGVYPVPAPATANLLTEATVYSRHVEKELVTPTGAAILAATVDRFDRFGGEAGMRIDRVGYGAGSMEFPDFPNCLRLIVGDGTGESRSTQRYGRSEEVVVIESNIDDMTPEQLAHAAETMMESGALDVSITPIVMKKGRPGHALQVMAAPSDEDRISALIFRETTTIGLRSRRTTRRVLDRESVTVDVGGRTARVKVARLGSQIVNVSPEFTDCARIASETHRPIRDIQEEVLRVFRTSGTR